MLNSFQSVFRIPELKRRIFFTALLLIVFRLGSHVPTPGVDARALATFFEQAKGTLFGLYDLFAGGSLGRATVFALGIMPYISASIILQLLGAVIPYFEKLQKEGEEGRKKITQYTRYGTVLLSVIQSFAFALFLENLTGTGGQRVIPNPGFGFRMVTVLTQTTGTIFIMWLGEQITEKGIGNGISLIIFIGIVARFPNDVLNSVRSVMVGTISIITMSVLAVMMLAVIASVILITQGQRRIPVQYAKRVVGRKMYGGQNTHIPLRVNTAGVIPIIFAQSIIMFPSTLVNFFQTNQIMLGVANLFQPGAPVYLILYSAIIIFFTYFYTAIVLNPNDLADNMKKYGGFIPGMRPGKKTAEYIDGIMTRITLPGAVFLAAIAVLPDVLIRKFNAPFYFGGTSLLIVVGVALDTLQQIESHLVMRHYDGFLKGGRIRGRR
ncbi:MAG: preprotein translocase subunit SecY [Candidatus Eisenbacteria bacterium]|nr:preprotein translocase subunit SecY [Candidatus Eisenbacteria bacterium]